METCRAGERVSEERGLWPEDKTDATQQYSPDSQSLFLGLLTGQTIDRRGAGSRRTRRRTTRWWRTRAEEDKFGKQQAWGQSTCKRRPGTGAAPLLYVGNISSEGTDRNKAAEEEPHKWAVQEARTSLAGVRKDWGEAYMRRRTMARPQQQRSPEKYHTAMGKPRPNSILSREAQKGAPSKSTLFCSEHIGAVTIQDEQTRVKDF